MNSHVTPKSLLMSTHPLPLRLWTTFGTTVNSESHEEILRTLLLRREGPSANTVTSMITRCSGGEEERSPPGPTPRRDERDGLYAEGLGIVEAGAPGPVGCPAVGPPRALCRPALLLSRLLPRLRRVLESEGPRVPVLTLRPLPPAPAHSTSSPDPSPPAPHYPSPPAPNYQPGRLRPSGAPI